MEMKNLCITLHLQTALIPGKYPLNLDGLLYWAAYEGSHDDEQKALEIVSKALASKDGVFCSSDMIYLQTLQGGITQGEAVFSTNFKWSEHKYPLNRKSIMELGGPYRSRLTTYNSINVEAVRFYAVGNPDLIRFLIESAGFIGRGNNQGHGEIKEITFDELDQDLSWYVINEDGSVQLNRCLPASLCDNIPELNEAMDKADQTLLRTAPPYITSPEVLGYSTNFRREVVTSL